MSQYRVWSGYAHIQWDEVPVVSLVRDFTAWNVPVKLEKNLKISERENDIV